MADPEHLKQIAALQSELAQARMQERAWKGLLDLSNDVFFQVENDRGVVYVSPSVQTVLGYAPESFFNEGKAWDKLLPESKEMYQTFREVFKRTGEWPEWMCEWAWLRPDGSQVYTENQFANTRDANGKCTGFITIARDITARKQAAEEIARAEAISHVIRARLSVEGRWEETSPRLHQLLGYVDEALPPWPTLLHPVDREDAQQRFALACQNRQPVEIDVRYLRKDGGTVWIKANFSPVHAPQGRLRAMLAYLQDITEQRRNEQALRDAQKLESLGVLAGGIAHDFNNLLTAMLGNITLALLENPSNAMLPLLLNVEHAAQRAADLTRQMLAYSGKGSFVVRPLDINRVLQEMALLLSVNISKKIKVHQDFSPSLPQIESDEMQLQQVIMSLVSNAAEAIGDQNGVISLNTRMISLSNDDLHHTLPSCPLNPGNYVALTITDTGCGMAADVMDRIFDPFFSTKGKGRGLGLSAVLGILRGHRSGLSIRSTPGQGSDFTLYLPVRQERKISASPLSLGAQGRIMVVDDEPALRAVARRMLEATGYDVDEAGDGDDVLDRLRAGTVWDMILLDLTMPRRDGKETLEAIRKMGCQIPVVICSGYDETEVARATRGQSDGFLQKPYRMEELRRQVEETLSHFPPSAWK